jgi:hypothetical protein
MRQHTLPVRPTRRAPNARQAALPTAVPRRIIRSKIVNPAGRQQIVRNFSPPSTGFQPDPYPDYGRYLTREGGILIIYKDLDPRLRHTLWRMLAWTVLTGLEAVYLRPYQPVQSRWVESVGLLVAAIINWLIVKEPVELYRRIEVRPDCLIVEGSDVFWTRFMECGFPTFRSDKDGNKILCGIYGTRSVEYLTVRRFDENDRMSEVLAAHLHTAMQQLWTRPY